MNYQGTEHTVDRWITANVSSCIFYGIDKLIIQGDIIAVLGLLV
jgi:hypothetical protein